MNERAYAALLASLPATAEGERAAARLHSCACRAASIWLETLPQQESLTLSNSDVSINLRHRLGLGQMPSNALAVECFCKRILSPSDTDHAMMCKSLSGAWTSRHDTLVTEWRRTCHCAGVSTSIEPPLRQLHNVAAGSAALRARPESRGDILIALPNALTVADVSVIHPAAPTYVRAAAQTAGSAAANRDQSKRDRYQTADPTGYAFTPLSTESYGRLGQPAMELLSQLGTIAAAGGSVDRDVFVANALRRLSIALCRGTGVTYRRSLTMCAKVTGAAFMPGLPVPSAEAY